MESMQGDAENAMNSDAGASRQTTHAIISRTCRSGRRWRRGRSRGRLRRRPGCEVGRRSRRGRDARYHSPLGLAHGRWNGYQISRVALKVDLIAILYRLLYTSTG